MKKSTTAVMVALAAFAFVAFGSCSQESSNSGEALPPSDQVGAWTITESVTDDSTGDASSLITTVEICADGEVVLKIDTDVTPMVNALVAQSAASGESLTAASIWLDMTDPESTGYVGTEFESEGTEVSFYEDDEKFFVRTTTLFAYADFVGLNKSMTVSADGLKLTIVTVEEVESLDENGDPVVDENGEPVYVATEKTLVMTRACVIPDTPDAPAYAAVRTWGCAFSLMEATSNTVSYDRITVDVKEGGTVEISVVWDITQMVGYLGDVWVPLEGGDFSPDQTWGYLTDPTNAEYMGTTVAADTILTHKNVYNSSFTATLTRTLTLAEFEAECTSISLSEDGMTLSVATSIQIPTVTTVADMDKKLVWVNTPMTFDLGLTL